VRACGVGSCAAREGLAALAPTERGIYQQQSGKFAVCVMVADRSRFRTLDAATIGKAQTRFAAAMRDRLITLGDQ
jgi:hypothetical protein